MQAILFVAVGGAIGAVLRFITANAANNYFSSPFPYGTLTVNLVGSLVIGLLWGFLNMETFPDTTKHLLFVGVLGAFTTFSTFSMENVHLLENGAIKLALINILLSNIGGIALAFGGYQLGKLFSS